MQDKVKFAICFVAFISAVRVDTTELKFGYRVQEGLARFTEDVDVDLDNNIVQFHVPNHNEVLESYIIQDFNRKKQITCYPSLQQCRLREIDDLKRKMDSGIIAESFLDSWNHGVNSISNENAVITEELYYADGVEVDNTVSLGDKMRQFYERFGFPLYREIKVPENATTVHLKGHVGQRSKRFAALHLDCRGQQPKFFYGIDAGHGCYYIRLCEELVNMKIIVPVNDCPSHHITSPMVYGCSCCPWVDPSNAVNANGGNSDCACTHL